MFNEEPLTEGCGRVLPTAGHACIGVSPFNSYFSTTRLTELARWALRRFGSCHFFIPDTVSAYTMEACGYSPERARHKARRQGQYTHNKVLTALRTLGVPEPQQCILGMEQLRGNRRYCELLAAATALFERDAAFRVACLEATHWVLDRKLPRGAKPTREQLRLAVRYFLAELPLFTDSGGIVAVGSGGTSGGASGAGGGGGSMFVYHQRVVFLERFYAGLLSWKPAPGQGFLVVTEPEQDIQAEPSALGETKVASR
ncbi:tRNA-dependent cyclodipeptide synthase [Streptomyces sp. p1417]|uniref:Cyclodipeptide synthase n=1 Tax=Streptomyces typhae TaxID=2681492 RepID=A0A6L6WVQ7_9ACTN|nr:tRNA-dependent cyclodipeptide synthase [Streptomyces typhae]MVO84031.1 tRNA-dependent cyclodipeptide synthase [Streptomyces typhae]